MVGRQVWFARLRPGQLVHVVGDPREFGVEHGMQCCLCLRAWLEVFE